MSKTCGIDAAVAQGYICKADDESISAYVQRGNNRGWLEVIMSFGTFAGNFEEDRQRADNISYSISRHFSKRYPEDYMR